MHGNRGNTKHMLRMSTMHTQRNCSDCTLYSKQYWLPYLTVPLHCILLAADLVLVVCTLYCTLCSAAVISSLTLPSQQSAEIAARTCCVRQASSAAQQSE
jgi:hypothetical protein